MLKLYFYTALGKLSFRRKYMYSSITIANKLLSCAADKRDTLTPMQLMKLVYLCHGWMLAIYGRQLVKEPIEAWLYGPVIPELYQATKSYRSSAISKPIDGGENALLDDDECRLIQEVYEKYGQYSGPVLSALTHQQGSPWHITWNAYGKNAIISNDLIEDYYRRQAQPTHPQLVHAQ